MHGATAAVKTLAPAPSRVGNGTRRPPRQTTQEITATGTGPDGRHSTGRAAVAPPTPGPTGVAAR